MTIEKHGNKYRIRQSVEGKLHIITVDHKPTKEEALKLIGKELARPITNSTFGSACEVYINSKSNVLSPSTKRGYNTLIRTIPESFMKKPLTQIKSGDVQTLVNDHAKNHSPKTTKNFSGFIMAVLKYHDVDIRPPKLPQMIKNEPYVPTEDDVRKVLAVIKDTPYESLIVLSCFGLRRSEIIAITPKQLDGSILSIDKATVLGDDGIWYDKTTKTEESTRTMVIPDRIADIIRRDGRAFSYNPSTISRAMQKFCKKAGVPSFSLHKMRHFFASYMHQLGYSDKQIESAGGWSSDRVMKSVYRHAMDMDEAKVKMRDDLMGLFD